MLQGIHDHLPIVTQYNYIKEKNQAQKMTHRFSKEGLRILAMGYKEITDIQINYWDSKINEAKLNGNCSKLYEIYDEIEKDLRFLGCSAIQDKLQEGVPETIKTLMECGIRVWVLTGDKLETAEQIGRQCNLIYDNMNLINFCKIPSLNNFFEDESQSLYNRFFQICSKYGLNEYESYIDSKTM